MKARLQVSILLTMLLLGAGCGGGGAVTTTDTGYEGTWGRGSDRVASRISIVKIDGEYKYRIGLNSDDGKRVIRCDWEGDCEEFIEGEKTSDYKFTIWFDESSDRLRVECVGEVYRPTPAKVHDIDELVVKADGLKLRRRAIQRGEKTYKNGDYPRPHLDYAKISDQVTEPPPGWKQPKG